MLAYLAVISGCLMPITTMAAGTISLSAVEQLGKDLFFDESLSDPPGQSCATCHGPEAGFSGPDSDINRDTAAYPGAVPTLFAERKPPTAAYAGDSPVLRRVLEDPEPGEGPEYLFIGGMFFDGRAPGWTLQDPLAEQAQQPFINPIEQNLPHGGVVVDIVRQGYQDRFHRLFGPGALDPADPEAAFALVAKVIAAYERSPELNPFSSKYDHYLRGQATLTPQEMLGLDVFENKGLCADCHPSQLGPDGSPPLFTDFSYDNLGVPRNPRLPFYDMPPEVNPAGRDYVDPGLGGFLARHPHWARFAEENLGKHKVPTLRNVDARPSPDFVKAYMHNGVFTTLEEVVSFYNTRDVGDWPPPEIATNLNTEELGDLKLTAEEEAALVAFMKTLTDGYQPAP